MVSAMVSLAVDLKVRVSRAALLIESSSGLQKGDDES